MSRIFLVQLLFWKEKCTYCTIGNPYDFGSFAISYFTTERVHSSSAGLRQNG